MKYDRDKYDAKDIKLSAKNLNLSKDIKDCKYLTVQHF